MVNIMECYAVKKLDKPSDIVASVPGSKSMTNRALLMAVMADGNTVLSGVQFSEDANIFIKALQDLGFIVSVDETKREVSVCGAGGEIPNGDADIYVGSAGTAARFLTAFTAFSSGVYRLSSSEQMERRPMRELLVALEEIGAKYKWLGDEYSFPFEVSGIKRSDYCKIKKVPLNIDRSSQFLSALLMTAPSAMEELTVELTGTRSARSYVEMTEQMMKMFGHQGTRHVQVGDAHDGYLVRGGGYKAGKYQIEPDVSAACYFYAAAAVTGGTAIVRNMRFDSLQGDMRFIDVLKQMGCQVVWDNVSEDGNQELCVKGPKDGKLSAVKIDMSDFSDQALTLAAIAPFADAPVEISGIGHIRRQESDRMQVIITELSRMGIHSEFIEDGNGIRIFPGEPKGAEIETYNDHRVAMSFALTGLRADGVIIKNPDCCKKTFAEYFDIFEKAIY